MDISVVYIADRGLLDNLVAPPLRRLLVAGTRVNGFSIVAGRQSTRIRSPAINQPLIPDVTTERTK